MSRTHTADLIVRAGAIHTMEAGARPATALAVRDGTIVALAGNDDEVELTRSWRGPRTVVLDEPQLTVLPAFTDTHNHLLLASRNQLGVTMSDVRSIDEIVMRIRERAAGTPSGRWVLTAADWHELQLDERRLPTAAELDRATTDHPVLVMRGGHNGVLNTAGLSAAGIAADTPDLPGGFIARDPHGQPAGWIQDAALEHARHVVPALPEEALAAAIGQASRTYAAHGLGTVRDPAVSTAEWQAYQRAEAAGLLAVRTHVMIFAPPSTIAAAGSVDDFLDDLEQRGIRPGAGEGNLRLWGLKFVLDGGVEAAALDQPYADRPDYLGEVMWNQADLSAALSTCVRRGWPVGTHVMGDRANALLLDAIGEVADQLGPIPRGMLVVEHGGLIAGRLPDAVHLGLHITVQQALLDGLGPALVAAWGAERAAALFPWRQLLDAGAWISAGTDHPIGPLDPLRAVHGMTTRVTPAGVLGPEQAIDRAEALRLYTVAGAELAPGPATGTLIAGAPADLVGYPADPFTCRTERLLDLAPHLTVVGGKVTYQASGSPGQG